MNTCPICSKEALYTYCSLSCSNKDRLRKNEIKYNQNPKLCKQCTQPIAYLKRWFNTFCSSACAATYNNYKRSKKDKLPKLPQPDKSLQLFQEGKLYNRPTIRRVLIKLHGNICMVCNLPGLWQNEPIVLIVDHKDGNAANNSPNNVRLLCPNCNSQTPTFSGRNKGNGIKTRGLPR